MLLLRRHKNELIGVVILFLFYLALRTIFLTQLPIFTDEAIYIRWAQIGSSDPNWRFISLVDGKQPLFVWFMMAFLKIIDDPLLAGRLVSVISGLFTLSGILLLTHELFKNKKVTLLAGLFYVVYPFAQVYDRMALMDGMVGTFAVWATYFSVLLVRRINLGMAYTLGLIIGAGDITKSSGFFSGYLLPVTILLFNFNKSGLKDRVVKWALYLSFAFLISQIIYNLLRLSPFFYIINLKNATFVYPLKEWIKDPFVSVLSNLSVISQWFLYYVNIYIVLVLAAFSDLKFIREKIFLLAYFLFPIVAYVFFGRVIFPRHIYFATLPLLPLAALGLFNLVKRINLPNTNRLILEAVVILAIIAYPLFVSSAFAINPFSSKIAPADKDQYIKNWTVGWGVKESASFFNEESKNGKIFVATQGTFGLMPYSYEIFLNGNHNIQIKGYWPINNIIPDEVLEKSKKMPTYFVFYQPCPSCKNTFEPPESWHLKPVFRSPYGPLTVYSVNVQ